MATSRKIKGDLAELKVLADLHEKGFGVSIPQSQNSRYDIVIDNNGTIERVQVKYSRSNGNCIGVKCNSTSLWGNKKYTEKEIEWLAVYDVVTDSCYYIPSHILGEGISYLSLWFSPPKNKTKDKFLLALDYQEIPKR